MIQVPTNLISANSSTTNTAGTPVQAATRPRLVAKSVSGHRAITPRSISIGSKNGKESGPDPMQVWNKNRGSIILANFLPLRLM